MDSGAALRKMLIYIVHCVFVVLHCVMLFVQMMFIVRQFLMRTSG